VCRTCQSLHHPAGLANLGATCYVNSALQFLVALPAFRGALYSLEEDLLEDQPIARELRCVADTSFKQSSLTAHAPTSSHSAAGPECGGLAVQMSTNELADECKFTCIQVKLCFVSWSYPWAVVFALSRSRPRSPQPPLIIASAIASLPTAPRHFARP